jgi:hypothetical protein
MKLVFFLGHHGLKLLGLISENIIPCFLKCINHGTEGVRTVAASALWALIYNNQKVRTEEGIAVRTARHMTASVRTARYMIAFIPYHK